MSEIAWSPDSRTIAFDKCLHGSCNIHVVAADGGNVRQLTNVGNAYGGVSWSPDGSRISFTTFNSAYRFSVMIVDAATGENARSLGEGSDPVWIPATPVTTLMSIQPPR